MRQSIMGFAAALVLGLCAGVASASSDNTSAEPSIGDEHCCPHNAPWKREGTHSCYRSKHECEGPHHDFHCHNDECH